MKNIVAVGIGVAVAASLAFGQSGSQASHIDVDGYTIDAQINPSTQTLNAHVVVRFAALDDQVSSATFELNNSLNISQITDAKGTVLNSARTQADNTVRVTFPYSLPKGQMTEITFVYDGRLSGDEESPIYGIKFAAIQNDYAFLLYPSRWFPISGYTADRFTSKMNITVPDGYRVIGSGPGISAPNTGGGTVFQYDFTKPSFPGDIAVVKGDPVKNSSDGVTTTLWFRGAQAEQANAYGQTTAEMLAHFTSLYGLAPYANLTLIETADGAPKGYAAPGLIFLNPQAISKDVNVNVLANQIARQWWEIDVSPVNRNHLWLENGMALYSEALWAEHDKGASAIEQRMRDTAVTSLTVDDVPLIQTSRLEDYSPEYWALSASKGAVVLGMLRSTMGDDKFFAALKDFLGKNAWKSATTADFRASCEAAYGEELRYFFIQWVENNGAPEFKLDYTIFRTQKDGKEGFRVQGKITQDLDTFRMPVDLKIETDGDPETKRVEVMGTSSEFSVDTFGKPKNVIIDPGNKVLRMSPQVRVDVAIRKGEQYVQIAEFAEALKEYQRALDTQKTSSMAHYRVGEVFFLQHNYQSAANEFREALNGDNNPKWVEVWAHIYLGKVFDITGQRDRAVNEYTQAQRTRDNTQGAQDEVAKFLRQPYSREDDEGRCLRQALFILFAAVGLLASPITLPTAPQGDNGQVFELQDYRWVQVVVRRIPTLIDCSFQVVTGAPSVHVELVSEQDFRQFSRHLSYETLEATETGHSGRFQRLMETPGRYRVLIRNRQGAAPVAVSLAVRTEVDPQNGDVSAGVTPLRRLVVILASLMIFSGTVMWSGRRLLRAWRKR